MWTPHRSGLTKRGPYPLSLLPVDGPVMGMIAPLSRPHGERHDACADRWQVSVPRLGGPLTYPQCTQYMVVS